MKIYLFLFLTAFSSLAQSQWKLISENESAGAKFFVEVSTIQKKDNYIRVWEKAEFQKEFEGMLSARVYQEFDCSERRNRTLQFDAYKKNNHEGMPFVSNKKPSEWTYVTPSSPSLETYRFLCKK